MGLERQMRAMIADTEALIAKVSRNPEVYPKELTDLLPEQIKTVKWAREQIRLARGRKPKFKGIVSDASH